MIIILLNYRIIFYLKVVNHESIKTPIAYPTATAKDPSINVVIPDLIKLAPVSQALINPSISNKNPPVAKLPIRIWVSGIAIILLIIYGKIGRNPNTVKHKKLTIPFIAGDP